jgi:hypothetical protein
LGGAAGGLDAFIEDDRAYAVLTIGYLLLDITGLKGSAAAADRRGCTECPPEARQIGEHWAEVPAALVAVARQQPNAVVAVGDDGEALPVVLDLVQLAAAGRRLARGAGELEGDARR